jgi:hypothetical protein
MRSRHQKGTHVTHPEHTAKDSLHRTGLFAALCAFLRAKGRGARSAVSSRQTNRASAALCGTVALLVFPSVASAHETHLFTTSFGEAGEGAGQVSLAATRVGEEPRHGGSGLAVNDTTGDLYVADTGNHRVDQFSASGSFIRAWGWGVMNASPQAQTCTTATGCQTGLSGTSPGQFEAPVFIAVDNSAGPSAGDVYVAEGRPYTERESANVISKFNSEGQLIASWGVDGQLDGATSSPGFGKIAGLAVDSAGDLDLLPGNTQAEVYLGEARPLLRFAQDGTFKEAVGATHGENPPSGLAADGTLGGHLFWSDTSGIVEEFEASAAVLGWVSQNHGFQERPTGLAVDPASGALFVDRGGADGQAESSSPGQISHYAFNGSGEVIEPGSAPCKVEPGVGCPPSDSFGDPAQLLGAAGIAVDPAGDVYLADTKNQRIDVYGPGQVPRALTGAFTEVTPTTAKISGAVFPEGTTSSYQFEYGPTERYGLRNPSSPLPAGADNSEHPESVELTGLKPSTVYHFRIIASDECRSGHQCTVEGSDATFRTTGPPTVDSQAAHLPTAPTAATVEAKVNPSGFDTHCRLEYGRTAAHGTQTALVDLGEAGTDQSFNPGLTGLTPGRTYHYGVFCENAQGHVQGADHIFATEPALRVDSASATEVAPTSATLNAQINPLGLATSYHFEYDTASYAQGEAAHGTQVPAADEAIGAGTHDVSVSQAISGLQANTTYHYRVVAHNSLGTETSPDHTFIDLTEPGVEGGCPNEELRTGPAAHLPDCRTYEQVTPAHKNAALIGVNLGPVYPSISPDGSGLISRSIQCFAGAPSCGATRDQQVGQPVAFERTASGWVPRALAPPASSFEADTPVGYDAEQGAALFTAPSPETGEESIYWRLGDGSLVEVGPVTPGIPPGNNANSGFSGSLLPSADLSHLLYNTSAGKWPFDQTEGGGEKSYEYVGFDSSQPLLVGVGGPHDGPGSTDLICRNGTRPVKLSADGRIAIFKTGPCSGGSGANAETAVPALELFARIDGESSDAHTVDLSQRSPSECSGECLSSPPAAAIYAGASEDASEVYFLSGQQLTDRASEDSAAGGQQTECSSLAGSNGCNLYLYDSKAEAGHNLIDISAGDSSGLGPEVQGSVAVSPDGSHAYFVAEGVLTGANSEGAAPLEGADNLYAYQRDASFPAGHLSFIATLPGSDDPQWTFAAQLRSDDVSPDGRYLLFTSHAPLTAGPAQAEGVAQIYRYDAQAEALTRVSIGERGFNDDGNSDAASFTEINHLTESLGRPLSSPSMSADGSRVFFTSAAALTPGALDHARIATAEGGAPAYATNIYEWEAQGSGSCREASGCVSLISDGRDTTLTFNRSSVLLLGTDLSGENVFFATADSLNSADTDTQLDFYDARVDGGFAEPPQPVECQTSEACHAATTTAGPAQSPATPGFNGKEEGAKNPEKCRKGLVRKGVKCVKPSQHRHKKPHKRAAGHKGGGGK